MVALGQGPSEGYLRIDMSFVYKQLIVKLRSANEISFTLTIKNYKCEIKPKENCTVCNTRVLEDLYHIHVACPMYSPYIGVQGIPLPPGRLSRGYQAKVTAGCPNMGGCKRTLHLPRPGSTSESILPVQ
ncbi:hypothetical protein GE061_017906 [Apolygus lucorum]|uniref:Uncharacterized protein n=1 Tax=Apolygus lucorum TaxID=248454 RepID=A0A8S9XC72_APOLU|nr:hypothetical protein GE061_017906 [Apolygus lucorum]